MTVSNENGSNSKSATINVLNASYSIFKSVIGVDENGDCILNAPRDTIRYRIVVKNEGDVRLTNIKVNDSLINLIRSIGDYTAEGVLNPGEVWIYTGNYSLKVDDIRNGSGFINNTATVSSNELPEKSSRCSQTIAKKTDLSIYKSIIGIDEAGDYMINEPGDVINYQIAVKNNGVIALTGVNVSDPMVCLKKLTGDSINPGVLNLGETWIYAGNYTVTQSDINTNGNSSELITNTATVSCNELPNENSSIQLPIITAVNTQPGTNIGFDNTSANRSDSNPESIKTIQTTSSSSVENNEESSGHVTIVSSSIESTVNTNVSENVTQLETNISKIEQNSTPASVQTSEPSAAGVPTKQSKKIPDFGKVSGIVVFYSAVYLNRTKKK